MSTQRLFAWLTVTLFALAIWLPLAGFFLGWPAPWLDENRVRASLPEPAPLRSYPGRFAAAFGDRFGFRDHLIRWNNAVTLLWLGDSMTMQNDDGTVVDFWQAEGERPRRIVNGGGEWFFHFSPIMMADQRGLVRADNPAVDAWLRELARRRAWLGARGIAYLFVVVPEKQTIYPEYLPDGLPPHGVGTDAVLTRVTGIDVLDLRPILTAAKAEGRTYHRTDTHWNAFGALVAYRAITARLQQLLPALASLPPLDVELGAQRTPAGRFLETLGIADLAPEETSVATPKQPLRARTVSGAGIVALGGSPVRVVETGRPELPRAVVVHDSFMEADLDRFLSEDFSRVTYIRSFRGDIIEREHPSVVIEELAERHLLVPPDTASLRQVGPLRRRPPPGVR